MSWPPGIDQLAGDERRKAVCLKCTRCYVNYDGTQCKLDPHGNPDKHQGVVSWLRRPYSGTCPQFDQLEEADG